MVRQVVFALIGLALAGCGLPLQDNPTPLHCVRNGSNFATCN